MRKKFMRVLMVFGVFAMGGLSQPALAGFESGNSLLTQCSADNKDVVALTDCLSYIKGVHDDFMFARLLEGEDSECTPETITNGQVRDVVIKYLLDNPEERHQPGPFLVRLAIMTAWPKCSMEPG